MAYPNGSFYSGALALVLGRSILGAGTTIRTNNLKVSVDAIIKYRGYEIYEVDADLKESLYKNYTVNSILQQTYTKSLSVDAFLDHIGYLTYNVDAKTTATVRLINVVDAYLIANRRWYGVDARLTILQTVPLYGWVDAYLSKSTLLTHSVDAYIPHHAIQYSVDTDLKKVGNLLTGQVDSLLASLKTLSYSVDCAPLHKIIIYMVDAMIQNDTKTTYSVDAVFDVAMNTQVTMTIQTRS